MDLTQSSLDRKAMKKCQEIYDVLKTQAEGTGLIVGGLGSVIFCKSWLKTNPKIKEYNQVFESRLKEGVTKVNEYEKFDLADGIIGWGWFVRMFAYEGLLDIDEFEDVFTEINILIKKRLDTPGHLDDFDLFYGSIGIGLYLNAPPFDNELLDELVKRMISNHTNIEHNWATFNIVEGRKVDIINYGLAHGLSSVIVFLSKYLKNNPASNLKDLVTKTLRNLIKQLMHCKQVKSKSLFPSYRNILTNETQSYSRLAWCYGDLGISIALWQAGEILCDETIKNDAINICLKTTERISKNDTDVTDAGICHGTAGIAHIYNRMYSYTGVLEFKEAANYWINETLNMAKFSDGLAGYKSFDKNDWQNDTSLLEGISGIGLVLLSHVQKEESTWDSCLLLS